LVATIKMLFISAQVRRLVVIHIYQGKTDPLEAAKKQRKISHKRFCCGT